MDQLVIRPFCIGLTLKQVMLFLKIFRIVERPFNIQKRCRVDAKIDWEPAWRWRWCSFRIIRRGSVLCWLIIGCLASSERLDFDSRPPTRNTPCEWMNESKFFKRELLDNWFDFSRLIISEANYSLCSIFTKVSKEVLSSLRVISPVILIWFFLKLFAKRRQSSTILRSLDKVENLLNRSKIVSGSNKWNLWLTFL